MLDWIRHAEEVLERWAQQRTSPPDRDLLILMLKGIHHMALDLSKLTASVNRSIADTDRLIAALPTPASVAAEQAAVDALAGPLDSASAKAETAVPAAPTGATGAAPAA